MKTLLSLLAVLLLLVVPLAGQEPQPKPAAPAGEQAAEPAPLPTADQILEKYVEQLGGKAALEKITSREAKGNFEVPDFGATGTTQMWAKAPDKTALTVDVPGYGVVQQGYDGTVAWDVNPQTGTTELSGAALQAKKLDSDFYRATHLKQLYPTLTVKGKQKVDARDAYLVEATPAAGTPEKWYFDTETGLLVRMDVVREGPQGTGSLEIYFLDYKEVDGVKEAFGIRQVLPGMTLIYKLDEVKHNVEIENAKFSKPAPAPETKPEVK